MPEAYTQLREITTSLEKHYRDMQDFEFTIEEGKLYMLQTRNGKRTGPAAVRVAVDMVEEGLIDKKRSGAARGADTARSAAASGARSGRSKKLTKIATGIAGVSGRGRRTRGFHFRRCGRAVREGPGDPGSQRDHARRHPRHGRLEGHFDRGWRMTSHAAVVARGMGRPCVVGAARLRSRAQEAGHGHIEGKKLVCQGRRLDLARRHDRRSLSGPVQDQ